MEAMNRFLELLPIMFAETLENGYISEEFFKAHGFPIDRDIDGNEWPLDTKADALLRTKLSNKLGPELQPRLELPPVLLWYHHDNVTEGTGALKVADV